MFTFYSLFAGCGSGTHGVVMAGGRCLGAIDNDETALRSHHWNMPKIPVHNLDLSGWRKNFKALSDASLILWTGPCQGLSQARDTSRAAKNSRNNDLFYILAECASALPKTRILVEQVSNVLNGNTEFSRNIAGLWKALRAVGRDIPEDLGQYVYNAWQFGLCQRRMRLLLPINPRGVRCPKPLTLEMPSGYGCKKAEYERAKSLAIHKGLTLRAAIGGFKNPEPEDVRWMKQPERKLFQYVEPGEKLEKNCTPKMSRLFVLNDWDNWEGKFKRLQWDEPCKTILTIRNWMPGRISSVHPEGPRCLSYMECRTLQGFPEKWRLFGDMEDRYRQIGNAVPWQMICGAINGYWKTSK